MSHISHVLIGGSEAALSHPEIWGQKIRAMGDVRVYNRIKLFRFSTLKISILMREKTEENHSVENKYHRRWNQKTPLPKFCFFDCFCQHSEHMCQRPAGAYHDSSSTPIEGRAIRNNLASLVPMPTAQYPLPQKKRPNAIPKTQSYSRTQVQTKNIPKMANTQQ